MTRRQWATMLGSVCSPSFPQEGVEALVDMLPLLAKFDDSFFTVETIDLVGSTKHRQSIPSLAEITAVFAKMRSDRLPVQVRMGASPSVPQLEAPSFKPTEAECARVDEQVAALKQEFARLPDGKEIKIEPKYLTKLQLALSVDAATLASRPDYRDALEMHRRAQEQRQ